jgi:hypothetical protein
MSESGERRNCPSCGESIMAVAKKCRFCGEYFDEKLRRANMPSPSQVERMLVPVGRPMSAIASGYLALFGVIPMFGLPFSIGAILTGLVALKTIKKNPHLSGAGRAWFGIILGGLATLVSLAMVVVMLVAVLGHR